MNKKYNKTFYNITRSYVKKYLTGNLGKVVEDDEKITCYVERSEVKKKDYDYTIACFGIGKKQKKIAKAYELNKPICYVIDGIEFEKDKVNIFGYDDCEVIIKNCNFGLDLDIYVNGKCTLDNTNITTFSSLLIRANELVIKNMDSEQIRVMSSKLNVEFGADNKIDVIDSNIGSQKKDINVSFHATNELNIVNSNIVGTEVECKSSVLNADEKSSLIATDKVNLQIGDFNPININVPTIVLNEEEIANLLREVKTQCESINSKKVLKYQEGLSVQPVSKVLKNKSRRN